MNSFLTLLRKDWRLNRVPVLGLAVMTVLVYFSFPVLQFWDWLDGVRIGRFTLDDLSRLLLPTARMSLALTVLVAAAFGGTAFADERRENWADFLAMMPVRRRQIVLSKLMIALGCLSGFCVFNGIIIGAISMIRGGIADQSEIGSPYLDAVVSSFAASFAMFGIAWLLSSFLKSAAIAACLALVGDVLLIGVVDGVAFRYFGHSFDSKSIAVEHAVVGIATIITGSLYYIRRVEP